MSRFQFVADHRDTFEVERLCQTVEVSRSSFYAWEKAAPGQVERAARDAALAARIKVVQAQDRADGAPRVTAELNDGAAPEERVNHKRVTLFVREHHLPGLRLRRRVRTTVPEPSHRRRCRTCSSGTPPPPHQLQVRRGPHLPAAGVRPKPLPGHRHRLLQPPAGGLGHRRPHAHRASSPPPCSTPPRPAEAWPARSSTRPRCPVHLPGLRRALQPPWPHPVHGRGRQQRRQGPWPSRSTPPSSASTCTMPPPGPTSCPAAATCSAGPPATTPAAATAGADKAPDTFEAQHAASVQQAASPPTACPRSRVKAPWPATQMHDRPTPVTCGVPDRGASSIGTACGRSTRSAALATR